MCNGRHQYCIFSFRGEMPNWLSYRGEGCSLSFHIPPVFHGLVLWVVHSNWSDIIITIINKRNGRVFFGDTRTTRLLCRWIRYISRSEMVMEDYCADDELGLYFILKPTGPAVRNRPLYEPVHVKEYGVHVIAEKLDSFEESEVGRNTVMPSPPLYHLLPHPHPHRGSMTASTPKQWSDFLFAELQNYNLNLWLFGKNTYFL